MSADTSLLLQRRDGPVLHLTLNRPEQRNAMSLALVAALRDALAEAERSGEVRVVVLRGAGGHFCAGGDVKDLAQARAGGDAAAADALARVSQAFGELCVAYASTGLATVAVLEGTVMGGGFGLACVVDVALAGDNVRFRLPETSLGVVPAQIAPYLVERLGLAEARRLAVTGGTLDAPQALALRLVHEAHPSGALDAALARLLHALLQNAPAAVAATKRLLAQARLQSPASLVDEAAQVFSRAVLGAEGQEGTSAFLGRRKPSWAPE